MEEELIVKKAVFAPVNANVPAYLRSLINRMNKDYGEGSVMLASEANLDISYLSSGCYALDFLTGGGFPESRISELLGPESSGKSTIATTTAVSFQKKYSQGIAACLDLERTFEKKYARRLGLDLERTLIISPDSGEQAVDLALQVINDCESLFLWVDSIAAMTPTKELESSMDQQLMGTHARLINRFMRVVVSRIKRNIADPNAPKTTALLLNQLREKIGVMFGSPEYAPGGKGKDFAASLRVKLFSSGASGNKIEEKVNHQGIEKKVLVGRVISFSVIKNKCGVAPFDTGEAKYFNRDHEGYAAFTFNNAETLFESGLFYEVIEQRPDGTYFWKSQLSKKTIHTRKKPNFIAELQKDEPLALELRGAILGALRKYNNI